MNKQSLAGFTGKNWYTFLGLWILALALVPLTVFRDTSIGSIFSNNLTTINVFQRLVGLTLFVLITAQIALGAYMAKLTDLLGGKIFRFHITEGIISYILMFVHPILGSLLGISLLPIFTRGELLYNLGRFAFILFTIAILAGLLRTKPFLVKHWRKFHILNYAAYSLIAVHSWFVGTDTRHFPFVIFYFTSVAVVSVTVAIKIYKLFRSSSVSV